MYIAIASCLGGQYGKRACQYAENSCLIIHAEKAKLFSPTIGVEVGRA